VKEHCLPFTSAASLGFLIRSTISFGLCAASEVPPDANAFRSTLAHPLRVYGDTDEPVFYVNDDPACHFIRNAFTLDVLDDPRNSLSTPRQPGISFFDREDQLDLFKVNLPYILRTSSEVDTLFLPVINRSAAGLVALSGLVETDWYANPVNLVFRQPATGHSVHIRVGDSIAQVIFLPRSYRRPALKVEASHSRAARDLRTELTEWHRQLANDHSAYKKLARSQHGRISDDKPGSARNL